MAHVVLQCPDKAFYDPGSLHLELLQHYPEKKQTLQPDSHRLALKPGTLNTK